MLEQQYGRSFLAEVGAMPEDEPSMMTDLCPMICCDERLKNIGLSLTGYWLSQRLCWLAHKTK